MVDLNNPNTYRRWQDGELTDNEALELLCRQLTSLQDRLEPLQFVEKQLRAWISEVVDREGGRAEVNGFGRLQITGASQTVTYDRRKLDNLVARLAAEGYSDLAQEIASYRKESSRSGGLRILREKLEE
jgi:hypothetical protein